MYNFPNNPLNGQIFTPATGGPSYTYDGTVWRVTSGGVAGVWIGDTPPTSPVSGQLWFQSSTGNTFIWYPDQDSAQWVQFNVAPSPLADHISSATADMYAGFKTSLSNRFVVNDKADGSGNDVFRVLESGQLQASSAGNNALYFLDGAGVERALIYADVNKLLHFRAAASANEVTIDSGGGLIAAGNIQINGGSLQSGQANLILGGSGGSGAVFLRPQGIASTAGQAYVNNVGYFTTNYGYGIKAGANVAPGASVFNINWNGSVTGVWIDFTYMGTFAFTSDYRTKKDVVDLPSQWETVKQLRPIQYTQAEFSPPSHLRGIAETKAKGVKEIPGPLFEADDIERWGFIAHELQETLIPSAANGVKDVPDEIQSPNPWTVIAALTSALQEAMSRIEALEGGAR